MTVLRFAVFASALVASIASAAAGGLPRFSTDPIPQALYLQFRNQVILAGKCEAYERASAPIDAEARAWKPGDPPVAWSPDALAEADKALDDCFRAFIAPPLRAARKHAWHKPTPRR